MRALRQRIRQRTQARIMKLYPVRAHEQLNIAPADAAIGMEEAGAPLWRDVPRAEIANAHIAAHAQIVQMLAPADQHLGILVHRQLHVHQADLVAPEIVYHIDALTRVAREQTICFQRPALHEGQVGILHALTKALRAFALTVYALCDQPARNALAHRALFNRAARERRNLPRRHGVPSHDNRLRRVVIKGEAQLRRNQRRVAARVALVQRAERIKIAVRPALAVREHLEHHIRVPADVDEGILLRAIAANRQLVLARPHARRQVDFVKHAQALIVRILIGIHVFPIQINGIVRLRRHAQKRLLFPRGKPRFKRRIHVHHAAVVHPDRFRVHKRIHCPLLPFARIVLISLYI